MTQPAAWMTGIVADDLTSAADAAMAFLPRGDRPVILRGQHEPPTARIVALDTGSRGADAQVAAKRTAEAIGALAHRQILLKTVDSTLRGHVRAEIAAAFRASNRRGLVVAPAFPAAGRITRDGIQFVLGAPVDCSPYALDPVHPARTSRIADLIDPALGPAVVLRPDSPVPDAAPVLILDAASQSELNHQVARLRNPAQMLWVGSPGMALALAELAPQGADRPQQPTPAQRVLVVAGSANPATHIQCDHLAAAGIPVLDNLSASVAADAPAICLAAPRTRQSMAPLANLVDRAAKALLRGQFDAVIATGGETMAAILERLAVTQFDLVRHLEPGFPAGIVRISGRTLWVAMKASGFGTARTLEQAVNILTGQTESSDA